MSYLKTRLTIFFIFGRKLLWKFVKNKFKGWIIDDKLEDEIEENINQMSQPFKENEDNSSLNK